jgi:acyl-CoA dehydrogenase
LRFRTLAPVVKYRAGEQNVEFARAAIEMLGGNGYVNTFGTPRLLRDAQVNPIWEGTSNICALDLQRAITKQQGHRAVFDHLNGRLDRLTDGPAANLADHASDTIVQATAAIDGLADAPVARREQQARRLADLVGDAVAIASMAIEADHEACGGDYRKALTVQLFAARRTQPTDPVVAITEGWAGVPDLYPAVLGDAQLGEDEYRLALAALALR